MVFHRIYLSLSKCNGSWIVFTKQNVNFNIQPLAMFVFLTITKVIWLKVVHLLEVYQHSTFQSPTLTGANFASTSEVWTSTTLEWLKPLDKNYGIKVTFNVMASLLNFINIYWLVQKLIVVAYTQTERWSPKLLFSFKWSRLQNGHIFLYVCMYGTQWSHVRITTVLMPVWLLIPVPMKKKSARYFFFHFIARYLGSEKLFPFASHSTIFNNNLPCLCPSAQFRTH
jgi:hypothetical protein